MNKGCVFGGMLLNPQCSEVDEKLCKMREMCLLRIKMHNLEGRTVLRVINNYYCDFSFAFSLHAVHLEEHSMVKVVVLIMKYKLLLLCKSAWVKHFNVHFIEIDAICKLLVGIRKRRKTFAILPMERLRINDIFLASICFVLCRSEQFVNRRAFFNLT